MSKPDPKAISKAIREAEKDLLGELKNKRIAREYDKGRSIIGVAKMPNGVEVRLEIIQPVTKPFRKPRK